MEGSLRFLPIKRDSVPSGSGGGNSTWEGCLEHYALGIDRMYLGHLCAISGRYFLQLLLWPKQCWYKNNNMKIDAQG